MIAPEERLPVVIETDFSGITKALGRMVAVAGRPLGRSARRRWTANRCRAQRARATSRPKAFADPTFEPTVLYGLVGISRSNLDRLFENSGRVTRYIQRKRLL